LTSLQVDEQAPEAKSRMRASAPTKTTSAWPRFLPSGPQCDRSVSGQPPPPRHGSPCRRAGSGAHPPCAGSVRRRLGRSRRRGLRPQRSAAVPGKSCAPEIAHCVAHRARVAVAASDVDQTSRDGVVSLCEVLLQLLGPGPRRWRVMSAHLPEFRGLPRRVAGSHEGENRHQDGPDRQTGEELMVAGPSGGLVSIARHDPASLWAWAPAISPRARVSLS